jgi:group I intron endonuclease
VLSPATTAEPHPVRERHVHINLAALGAELRGREEAPDPDAVLEAPRSLVFDLTHELAEGSVEDRTGQLGRKYYNGDMTRGVYTITCKANGCVYIGQSLDVEHRFLQHKSKLRRDSHSNHHLQAAWNKYGEESFVFAVHEWESDSEACDALEQKAVDFYRKSGVALFNIRPASATNRGVRFSEQTRQRIGDAIRKHLRTPEAREKHSMAIRRSQKPCRLRDPEGTIHEFYNPTAFAEANGLKQGGTLKLLRGFNKSHYGWTNPDIQTEPKQTNKLTEEQKQEACSRYLAGETCEQIAGAFGVTKSAMNGLLKRRGVKMRPRSMPKAG